MRHGDSRKDLDAVPLTEAKVLEDVSQSCRRSPEQMGRSKIEKTCSVNCGSDEETKARQKRVPPRLRFRKVGEDDDGKMGCVKKYSRRLDGVWGS